jgi:hypothetical protein
VGSISTCSSKINQLKGNTMAYVAISRGLLEAVKSNIREMRRAEENALPENPVNMYGKSAARNPLEPWLEERIWENALHLKSVLPSSWIAKQEKFDLVVRVQKEDGTTTSVGSYRFEMPNTLYEMPPQYRNLYAPDIVMTITSEMAATNPFFKECVDYATKRKEVDKRWDDVKTAVFDYLGKCKSLNQAIKLWPGIAHYIPKEYVERVEEKIERRAREADAQDSLKSIDTDAIEAAAVIARLSTQS